MLRNITVSLLLATTILASCNINKQEDAMKYSNEIAATNDTLAYHSGKWAGELKVAINTLDFSQLQPYRERMVQYIDRKVVEVQQMPNIGGSEKLQQAELEYLKFERTIVNKYFSVFEQMDSTTTLEAIENAYLQVMQQGQKEQQLQQDMQKLRDEYADKNNIPKPIE